LELTAEFWLQIIIYIASLSAFSGSITARIKYLERKQDKHNNVLERIAKAEASTVSAHQKIKQLHEDVQKINDQLSDKKRGGY